MTQQLVAIHAAACQREDRSYIDPVTGFTVLTEVAHLERGMCCGNACRHCPYDWESVEDERFEGLNEARQARKKRRAAGGL